MIASLLVMAMAMAASNAPVAPKPLYRDPVHDGAADASTVYDKATGEWVMFYTNRRADLPRADDEDGGNVGTFGHQDSEGVLGAAMRRPV